MTIIVLFLTNCSTEVNNDFFKEFNDMDFEYYLIRDNNAIHNSSEYRVGDILFADGGLKHYSKNFLPVEKANAVGVVFSVESDCVYVVSKYQSSEELPWYDDMYTSFVHFVENINFFETVYEESLSMNTDLKDDGYDNTIRISKFNENNTLKAYPPVLYATTYGDGSWFLPSLGALYKLNNNYAIVNESLKIIDGDEFFENHFYWTSSQHNTNKDEAYSIKIGDFNSTWYGVKTEKADVCVIKKIMK